MVNTLQAALDQRQADCEGPRGSCGVVARLLAGYVFGRVCFDLSIGAPEEIRTPDPQIRRLPLHLPRSVVGDEKMIYRWFSS
jgi:hypothetical protein